VNVRSQLDPRQTDSVRTNVMWVVAQVLGHADPNLDPYEFAEACGVDTRTPSGRPRSGHITAGLRGSAPATARLASRRDPDDALARSGLGQRVWASDSVAGGRGSLCRERGTHQPLPLSRDLHGFCGEGQPPQRYNQGNSCPAASTS
jgi:hypothetical protein